MSRQIPRTASSVPVGSGLLWHHLLSRSLFLPSLLLICGLLVGCGSDDAATAGTATSTADIEEFIQNNPDYAQPIESESKAGDTKASGDQSIAEQTLELGN